MPEIILHHYPQSPVSEKVRVVLGMKALAWRSVLIPRLPPKPDLMPLTGGYRLTPVMQIVERRQPEPTLFPGGADGLAWGVSRWTDGPFFTAVIAAVFGDAGENLPEAFAGDRGPLYFGPDFDLAALTEALPETLVKLRVQFGWIEARLTTGRDFMLGAEPGLPDALCYYLVWFIRGRYSKGPEFLSQFPKLCAWEERVKAIGHGQVREMDATEALDIAKAATPDAGATIDSDDPLGLSPGQTVTVSPEDTDGGGEVTGTLARLNAEEVAVARADGRVGQVAVHFPRLGYRLRPV
jgi:glutathione S-transferase